MTDDSQQSDERESFLSSPASGGAIARVCLILFVFVMSTYVMNVIFFASALEGASYLAGFRIPGRMLGPLSAVLAVLTEAILAYIRSQKNGSRRINGDLTNRDLILNWREMGVALFIRLGLVTACGVVYAMIFFLG